MNYLLNIFEQLKLQVLFLVFRVKKDSATMGRYVDTDYDKCIGCHICADVCPTGYIKMGLGE